MIYFILAYIITYAIHIYTLIKWTGQVHILFALGGLIFPPAAIFANWIVFYESHSEWDGVIWRKK